MKEDRKINNCQKVKRKILLNTTGIKENERKGYYE